MKDKKKLVDALRNPAALGAFVKGDIDNFIVAATPGGIERQEAEGQKTMVSTDILPKEMLGDCSRDKLESMGIEFKDDYDDIFVRVILPAGWKKVPTEHSMWSQLIDDKGRKRASIFYKAAFYDRHAHIILERRFLYRYEPEDRYESEISYEERESMNWYGVVTDCGQVIHKTDPIKSPTYQDKDKLGRDALKWLDKHYPSHTDPMAYWD